MAKTISITIPDDLYERLQEIKKTKEHEALSRSYNQNLKKVRKSFNVSKVCQVAISDAIEKEELKFKEAASKELKRIEDSFKNMRQQYKDLKKEFDEKGIEMAPEMERIFG